MQPGQEQALEQEMNQGQIIQDTVTGDRELQRRARTWPFSEYSWRERDEREVKPFPGPRTFAEPNNGPQLVIQGKKKI